MNNVCPLLPQREENSNKSWIMLPRQVGLFALVCSFVFETDSPYVAQGDFNSRASCLGLRSVGTSSCVTMPNSKPRFCETMFNIIGFLFFYDILILFRTFLFLFFAGSIGGWTYGLFIRGICSTMLPSGPSLSTDLLLISLSSWSRISYALRMWEQRCRTVRAQDGTAQYQRLQWASSQALLGKAAHLQPCWTVHLLADRSFPRSARLNFSWGSSHGESPQRSDLSVTEHVCKHLFMSVFAH